MRFAPWFLAGAALSALGWTMLGAPPAALTKPSPLHTTAGRKDAPRPVPHPRCFPEGTEGVAGFAACPDSLPQERRA